VEISMEEVGSLDGLTPAEEGDGIDVEDVFEPEAELEEIEETPLSAPPLSVPWDLAEPTPAKPEAKAVATKPAVSELESARPPAVPVEAPIEPVEELALDSSEEVAEELPVALTDEEAAEAPEAPAVEAAAEEPAEAVAEVSADAPELSLSLEEVSAEALPAPVEAVSADAPELSLDDVSAEALPAPVEAVSADAPELSLEEVSAEALPAPVKPQLAKAPELSLEEVSAEALSAPAEPEPAPAPFMPSEEVVAEAQVAKVGEQVVEAPRPPVDLGELPPVPEEPMQLAANWEFIGMAEAQVGATSALAEERGLELDTAVPSMPDYTGNPEDEVALAPAWDFVPQWQPQQEAPKSEPSAPPAPSAPSAPSAPPEPPAIEEPALAVSPSTSTDVTVTDKYGLSNARPAMTGKYGIASAEPESSQQPGLGSEEPESTGLFGVMEAEPEAPEAPETFNPTATSKYGTASATPASAAPAKTGRYGTVSPSVVTAGRQGLGPPESLKSGQYKVDSGEPVEPAAEQPGAGEEPGWDQLISTAEPELPLAELSAEPLEPDPFTEFAEEAARAKTAPVSAPAPRPAGAAGSNPLTRPPGSPGEDSGSEE
jgi:hypothetical protein